MVLGEPFLYRVLIMTQVGFRGWTREDLLARNVGAAWSFAITRPGGGGYFGLKYVFLYAFGGGSKRWLKIKQGQTAGFGPGFHLPGQPILVPSF